MHSLYICIYTYITGESTVCTVVYIESKNM